MSTESTNALAHGRVEAVYRAESRRVFATLVRLLGDFDLAEEALHAIRPIEREQVVVTDVDGLQAVERVGDHREQRHQHAHCQ